MNVALKIAIFESGQKQRDIAMEAGIGEVRLSHIVRGRVEATKEERAAIAKVLRRPVKELFSEAA